MLDVIAWFWSRLFLSRRRQFDSGAGADCVVQSCCQSPCDSIFELDDKDVEFFWRSFAERAQLARLASLASWSCFSIRSKSTEPGIFLFLRRVFRNVRILARQIPEWYRIWVLLRVTNCSLDLADPAYTTRGGDTSVRIGGIIGTLRVSRKCHRMAIGYFAHLTAGTFGVAFGLIPGFPGGSASVYSWESVSMPPEAGEGRIVPSPVACCAVPQATSGKRNVPTSDALQNGKAVGNP